MIVFVLTTMALALVDDASLEWSNAVLIDPWTYTLPVPDGFHAFDERHFFGLGGPATATDLLWQFSADAGKTWRNTSTPGSVPHPDTPLLRTAPGVLQSLGGGLFQTDEHGWRIQNPKAYALLPDGSGFSITAAPGGGLSHFVNFTGVPAPGVNISGDAIIKSGTRNYGVWMCRCVDVWTCGYRCVDVWMCGRVGHVGRVDVWICRRVYEWMCGCADVYIRVRVRAFACACVRDRSTLPPNMHTRTHAHAHTHTCTRTRTPPLSPRFYPRIYAPQFPLRTHRHGARSERRLGAAVRYPMERRANLLGTRYQVFDDELGVLHQLRRWLELEVWGHYRKRIRRAR